MPHGLMFVALNATLREERVALVVSVALLTACIAVPPPLVAIQGTDTDTAADASDSAADGEQEVCVAGCLPASQRVVEVVAGAAHTCARLATGTVFCFGSQADGATGTGFLRADTTPPVALAVGGALGLALAAGERHTCMVVAARPAGGPGVSAQAEGGGEPSGVICWGDNRSLQTQPVRSVAHWDWHPAPVAVEGLGAEVDRVDRVALGGASSCAITSHDARSEVVCWGARLDAEDDSVTLEPTTVGGLADLAERGLVDLVVGAHHACVRTSDGEVVRCWGRGEADQLGDARGTRSQAALPPHEALSLPVDALAAAADYTCALVEGGQRVACWGATPLGPRAVPTRLAHRFDPPLTRLVAGPLVACGIDAADRVHCWGDNGAGQLADPGLVRADEPVVVDLPETAALALGARHSCAVARDGALACWGETVASATPSIVAPTLVERSACDVERACTTCDGEALVGCAFGCVAGRCRAAVQVQAGTGFECVRLDDGHVWCGGLGRDGGLGRGPVSPFEQYALAPVALPGPVSAMAGASEHTCVLVAGVPWCWGRNVDGALGVGDELPRDRPTPLPLADMTLVAAGGASTCASDGSSVWCWGRALDGRSGAEPNLVPTLVPGVGPDVAGLAVGSDFACVVTSGADPSLKCWGNDLRGQVSASPAPWSPPTTKLAGRFASLSLGKRTGCVVAVAPTAAAEGDTVAPDAARRVLCWGSALDGIIAADSAVPVDLSDRFPAAVAGVALQSSFACAWLVDGRVGCWGRGGEGQLFRLDTDFDARAVQMSPTLAAIASVAVGPSGACAIDARGLVRCWGANICGTPPWRPNPHWCPQPQLVGELDPWP